MIFLLIVPGLPLLVVCVTIVVAGRRELASGSGPLRRRFWMSVMKVGVVLSFVRVSILWVLTYREWSGAQDLSELFFGLFLFPEILLTPIGATPSNLVISTVFLTSGS